MLSFQIGTQESFLATPLIENTEKRLREGNWPVWVSDGLDAYGEALKKRHCLLQTFPRTGKRGRPRRPKLVACPELQYGQVVKERNERRRVVGVYKRSINGDIPLEKISTVYVERHNLNLRHENRRLTRKTIAFSKEIGGLHAQMSVYKGYFNFVRPHYGLRVPLSVHGRQLQKWLRRTPGMAAGLTNHVWSLKEFMSIKTYINY
jgi:hypothetical protein